MINESLKQIEVQPKLSVGGLTGLIFELTAYGS